MSLIGIASRAGTTSANVEALLRNGVGCPGLAARIGTTTNGLTEFITGKASPGIAAALGTTTQNAQELRNALGREGAIGLVLGLACGLGKFEA